LFVSFVILAQSPEKLPANKVAGIVDSKVGVATCFVSTESGVDNGGCETVVKQLAVKPPDTGLEQVGFLSADSSGAEGCVSLHEDESLPMRGREQQQSCQPARIHDNVGHVSAETRSDNCYDLSVSSGSSQFCVCSPALFKSTLVLPFWYWLTQVVLEKRPLNGCSSSFGSSVL